MIPFTRGVFPGMKIKASEFRWGERNQRGVKSGSDTKFLPTKPAFLPPTKQKKGDEKGNGCP